MIFFCRKKRKIQGKYLNQLSKYYNPDEFFNVFIASNFYFCYYYYYCYHGYYYYLLSSLKYLTQLGQFGLRVEFSRHLWIKLHEA